MFISDCPLIKLLLETVHVYFVPAGTLSVPSVGVTEKLEPLHIEGPVSEVIFAIAGLGFTLTTIVNADAVHPLDKVGKTVYVID